MELLRSFGLFLQLFLQFVGGTLMVYCLIMAVRNERVIFTLVLRPRDFIVFGLALFLMFGRRLTAAFLLFEVADVSSVLGGLDALLLPLPISFCMLYVAISYFWTVYVTLHARILSDPD
jgi:hypothetical protein